MRKAVLAVMLALVIFACAAPAALAADGSPPPPPRQDEGGFVERWLAAPVDGLVSMLNQAGFADLNQLFFAEDEKLASQGIFSAGARGLLDKWFGGFRDASLSFLVVVILINGIRYLVSSGNPRKREELMDSLTGSLFGVFAVLAVPWAVDRLMELNYGLVRHVAYLLGAINGIPIEGIPNVTATGSVLGTAIVKLYLAGLMVYMNFLYMVRMFVVGVLYIITPLVCVFWGLQRSRLAIGIWSGELFSNIFMQSAHAVTYAFFLMMISPAGGFTNWWWMKIVAATIIVPVSSLVRQIVGSVWSNLFGLNEEAAASLGGGAVLGALGSMAGLGRAMVGGGFNASGGLVRGPGGGGGFPGGGGGGGGVEFSSPGIASAVAKGATAGRVAGSIGGALGSAAGSVFGAGLNMGGHTQQSMARLGGGAGYSAASFGAGAAAGGGSMVNQLRRDEGGALGLSPGASDRERRMRLAEAFAAAGASGWGPQAARMAGSAASWMFSYGSGGGPAPGPSGFGSETAAGETSLALAGSTDLAPAGETGLGVVNETGIEAAPADQYPAQAEAVAGAPVPTAGTGPLRLASGITDMAQGPDGVWYPKDPDPPPGGGTDVPWNELV